ncbi:putative ABC multidrug transporter [Taphrina deformans PYCC 5710]|uniref:ABC multidrug transporter n=1 Tax=Taphrina deformans (strain PYCC 5710 / ATCC 11124 / CBS 356.35 / IMI 108563 / JCM 9778 / NBRC 8474) TaxID=1097556 RepID=R4XDA0_TAPDE|nr:putative ABC multidrug transporter [Taphrina deformans PYCC 5710]|eukprot:CCG83568.1 putative ABC multidrug transporter [Taphrina deformans PYCC 5710]
MNTTLFSKSSHDFGPTVPGQFDFTLLFQDTVLSIIPSIVLLLFVPARVTWLFTQSRKVRKSDLHESKLLFLVVYACMRFALVIMWSHHNEVGSVASLPAAALSFIDAVALCVLSHMEHIRSIRPSEIINVYLLFTLLFDIVQTRTLWLNAATFSSTLPAVLTSSVGVKLLLLVTEAKEKRGILLEHYLDTSPEVTSGIYSRSFFWWLNKLMQDGFQGNIKSHDLYPIDHTMSSDVLKKTSIQKFVGARRTKSLGLFTSTIVTVLPFLLNCIIPRLCLIGFKYTQPLLLTRTINFANDSTAPDRVGWGLTAAFGVVLLGLAISNGLFYHMVYRMVVATRGALVGQIYGKTVELSITALDQSAAVTLMSNDVETICLGASTLHELWAVPLECVICLYLLQRDLGLSFLASAGMAIAATSLVYLMGNYLKRAQVSWIRSIQTRVDVTANMLSQMKAIKMLGFSDRLQNLIHVLRLNELELSLTFRRLLWVRVVISNAFSILTPFFTFSVFMIIVSLTGQELQADSAYSSLTLIALLAGPINSMTKTLSSLSSSVACYTRIQAYLNSDSRIDHRIGGTAIATSLSTIPSAGDGPASIELTDLQSRIAVDTTSMIRVRDANFSWAETKGNVLKDLNFEITRHSLTFIVGPVSSGKSTLLKGLLGEVPATRGFVYTNVLHASFVDQTPWIQNMTVRDNIVGPAGYRREWYNKVVHACAFDVDIAKMARGDLTRVGSSGISLSGGQKQRLALARAVYSQQSLMLLDDVFSGLDATTEAKIFSRLLGKNGLLKRMKVTVVLVTHARHLFAHADYMIVLSAEGRILEQGTFPTLRLCQEGHRRQTDAEQIPEQIDSEVQAETISDLVSESSPPEPSIEMDHNNEWSTYGYYFKSFGWTANLIFGLSVLVSGSLLKLSQLIITYWTEAVSNHGNSVNAYYYGIFAAMSCVTMFVYVCSVWLFILKMVPKSAQVLHTYLLHAVIDAPLSFFTSTDTGTTINRFSQDLTVIDSELPFAFINLVFNLVETIIGAVLMCISAKVFSAVVPPVLLALWVLQKYYLRTSKQLRILDLEAKSPLYSNFIETLSGLTTLRAFGWTQEFEKTNSVLLDISQKPYYLLYCVQRWLALVLDLMVTGLALILMVLIVKLRTEIGGGFVGLALLNILTFNESLSEIVKGWTLLETSFGAVARLKDFNEATPSENLLHEVDSAPEGWPCHGAIEFENVFASYTASSDLVIRDLTLSIKAGQKIGVCGRSGSGKSSLVTCLFRMLEVAPGSRITIDDVDITKLPRQKVREVLNAIPQDPCFLRTTIRRNVDPESEHTDEAIAAALERVQLWNVVETLGGLDTDLDLESFSHGQRQLFCLARAMLKKSKIVILDEATSSVDHESDNLMQRIIRSQFWDCTIIAVAHRLDTILDFDKIVVLDAGKVVEFDEPAALLARPSQFRELYNNNH